VRLGLRERTGEVRGRVRDKLPSVREDAGQVLPAPPIW
jgi:hypothetical protein